MYLVSKLDLADRIALVELADPGYATVTRELTSVDVDDRADQGGLGTG